MARLTRDLASKLPSDTVGADTSSTTGGSVRLLNEWVEQADAGTAARRIQAEQLTTLVMTPCV